MTTRPTAPHPMDTGEQSATVARPHGRVGLRRRLGGLVGAGLLGVLLWRLGTGPLLDGLGRIDGRTVLLAVGIGVVTTVCSAWRWQSVAAGLGLRLPLGPAVADYYRALFLNAVLPGGVLGDAHRAVRHGRSAGDVRRAVTAVVLERVAGQLALAVTGALLLATLPSPVRAGVRAGAPAAGLAAAGVLAVVLAVRLNRPPARRDGAPSRRLGEVRRGLASRRGGPGIALSSVVVLAGHLALFAVAARVAGVTAPVTVLLPLAVLALLAMGLPLNVGGFGPREGVTAWAFGAAGLGADRGMAVAVVYGVLGLVASLPGAAVLLPLPRRLPLPLRRRTATVRTRTTVPDDSPTAGAAPMGPGRRGPAGYSAAVSSQKYGPKDSARLASSFFPLSAEPREGRPMTPDSV
ncbi:flippase-like domain-containing protein [Streptomyces lavenduligriseus]|nr:flippase-like domain-containing protein [Streptomyces lavenduligriseus]